MADTEKISIEKGVFAAELMDYWEEHGTGALINYLCELRGLSFAEVVENYQRMRSDLFLNIPRYPAENRWNRKPSVDQNRGDSQSHKSNDAD